MWNSYRAVVVKGEVKYIQRLHYLVKVFEMMQLIRKGMQWRLKSW